MSLVDAFIEASEHVQLTHPPVAREAVYILRHHGERITPPVLSRMASMLGMPMANCLETAMIVAAWLESDGWIQTSGKSFAGRGMSAVSAYEATAKWRELAG